MIARHFLLSGQPADQAAMCSEMNRLFQFLNDKAADDPKLAASNQRKDMVFTLKIYDKKNNEHHRLKYNGRKSISDIRRDVKGLTHILMRRQIWSGWPPNSANEVIFLIDFLF